VANPDVPAIDYTSRDYEGFKASLLDYAARKFPQWVPGSEGDFGVLLIELFSYLGDSLSYYGDRLQQEAFLPTATQRLSLLQIADLLGYSPSNGVPASGTVTFQTSNPGPAVLVPAGTQVVTDYIESIDGPITYETDTDILVPVNGGTATVPVTQGVTRTQVNIGTSSGLPVQEFRLPDVPVINGTVQVYRGRRRQPDRVDVHHVPGGRRPGRQGVHNVPGRLRRDVDPLRRQLNGAIPTNQLTLYATYRVGGGAVGNVNAGVVNAIASSDLPGVTIGQDSTASAHLLGHDRRRRRGDQRPDPGQRPAHLPHPGPLRHPPGLLRPGADPSRHRAGQRGRLDVHQHLRVRHRLRRRTPPARTTLNTVQTALQAKALAGTTVTVVRPDHRQAVNVGSSTKPIVVECWPRYSRASVLYDVQQALKNMLSFANVDFGMRLTLSDFYKALLAVDGVRYADIPMIARADAAQTGTADVVFRAWEIAQVGNISNITMTGGIG
jgi:hypothetical protein